MADIRKPNAGAISVRRALLSRLAKLAEKARLKVRLSRAEAVGDWEMAFNRLAAGLMVVAFNLAWPSVNLRAEPGQIIAPLIYIALGLAVLAHCTAAPGSVLVRRSVAMALDFAAVSYEIHIGGSSTAWLVPAYLWVTFGNGFRFGEQFLIIATSISAVSFSVTALITPFWRSEPPLSAGLLVGMIIVPLYSISLIRKLSEARRRAEVANDAKSLFLASVSHELRTPLNTIVGTGALLEAVADDPDQQEMSKTVMSAARTLLSLIDGILDLSRIEAGKMPTFANEFDLAELLGQIRRMMVTQAEAKDLFLNLYVSARTPVRLYGDDRRLREILLNLISNAIKFTAQGGVTLSVDAINDESCDSRVRFEVTDSGIGIEHSALGRIFDTFEQANSTILYNFGGTGLGLSITKKLVTLLKGEIGVESTEGKGSNFWFELSLPSGRLPIAETDRFQGLRAILLSKRPESISALVTRLSDWRVSVRPATPSEASALSRSYDTDNMLGIMILQSDGSSRPANSDGVLVALQAQAAHRLPHDQMDRRFISTLSPPFLDDQLMTVLSMALAITPSSSSARLEITAGPLRNPGLRILVADDNRMNQLVMTKILQKAGHTVKVVGDGGAAIEAMTDEEFDAAIMDVNMPVMTGIEVVQEYRFGALQDLRLPILGLTADASPETRTRCLAAGMDASITKPIEPKALLSAIDEVVSRVRPREPKPGGFSGQIAEITWHAKFKDRSATSFDRQMINHLHELGGAAFVQEVIDEYLGESKAITEALHEAYRTADVENFRTSAHALRSGATNLGILRVSDLCKQLETISADDLAMMGPIHLRTLSTELTVVEDALLHWDARGMAKQ